MADVSKPNITDIHSSILELLSWAKMYYTRLPPHRDHDGHHLQLELEGPPFICDGCNQQGWGSRYHCEKGCAFHLHKCCASPLPTAPHPFDDGCEFVFYDESISPGIKCHACDRPVDGYIYHNESTGLSLHPCCVYLPQVLEVQLPELVEAGEMMRLHLHNKVKSKCSWCKRKKLGKWSYVSESKKERFHISCVMEMVVECWERVCLLATPVPAVTETEEVKPEAVKAEVVKGEDNHGRQIVVRRAPNLQLAAQGGKSTRSMKKLRKMKVALTMIMTAIMAAVFGDPVSMVIGVASAIAHS